MLLSLLLALSKRLEFVAGVWRDSAAPSNEPELVSVVALVDQLMIELGASIKLVIIF